MRIITNLSLRYKFVFLLLLAVVIPMVFSLLVVDYEVKASIHKTQGAQLAATQNHMELVLGILEKDFLYPAQAAARTSAVQEMMKSKNQQGICSLLQCQKQSFIREQDVTFIIVQSPGMLPFVVNYGPASASKKILQPLSTVEPEEVGINRMNWVSAGENLYLIGYVPVKEGTRILGYLGVGRIVDQSLLDLLQVPAGMEAAFYAGPNLAAASARAGEPVDNQEPESDSAVTSTVFNQGRPYLTQRVVDGQKSSVYFAPLRNQEGRTVGMLELQAAEGDFLDGLQTIRYLMLLIVAAMGLTAVVFGNWLSVHLTSPLRRVAESAGRVGEGKLYDLSFKEGNDEIGQVAAAFVTMIKRLKQIIAKVVVECREMKDFTKQLTSGSQATVGAANEIAATSEQLAAGAESQMTNIDQVMFNLNQLQDGAQTVMTSVRNVQETTRVARRIGEHGAEVLTNAIAQLGTIDETMRHSAGVVKELEGKSVKIGQIIDIIRSISKQTDLLALNAAIEAARAGDQGRGFAVVASEVRNLAEQSAAAATQVTDIVKEIQMETMRAKEAMGVGTEGVTQSTTIVSEVGEMLKEIIETNRQASAQIHTLIPTIEDIVAQGERTADSAAVVVHIANEIVTGSQSIAGGIEEQVAASENIARLAVKLEEMAYDLDEVTKFFYLEKPQE